MRRYPRIYDVNLNRIGELRTAKITDLKKKQTPFSTVTVTVPVQDIGSFGYRQFVELFDAAGERIDIFRVTGIPDKKYAPSGMVKLTCDHALCTLKDGLIPGYHQFGGTTQDLRGAVEAVLAFQSVRHWVLDRCEYDTHHEYGICDEKPYTALTMLLEPLEDPIIVTDTSTYPWKLSILKMTDEDASELRFSRNMEEITEIIQEADFATRLYPRGYGEGVNQLTIRDVNGGVEYIEAPQAVRDLWGEVSLPYIDTTITDAATLKAKCEVALAICQNPHVSYEVSAVDLSMLTGEPMDSFYEGRMVRMIYKDYGLTVRTRVTEIHKPDPIEKPGEVKLTLSSQPTSVATIIADLARKSKINDTYGQGSTFIYADSFEQNADVSTPAEGDIYIPETMIHVNAVMLKVTLSNYRADSKGAAGGGGVVQTTAEGGGGTRTSTAGGGQSVTVEQRTASEVIVSGSPMVDGASSFNTGYALASDGSNKSSTDAATGNTGSIGEQTTGVSRNGDGSMTSTGSTTAGGTVAENSNVSGYTSPGTGSSGDHSHSGKSHRHAAGQTHRHTCGDPYTTYNSPGSTDYTTVGTEDGGDHSHTVDSHCHTMNHGHTFTGSSHSHSMGHWHLLDGHSHTLGNHTHGMIHRHEFAHYHQVNVAVTIPGQTLTIDAHSHDVEIPDHSHQLTLEDHEHDIVYGIYKGPTADAFVVKIDGAEIPSSVFANGEGDIAPYLSTDDRGKIRRGVFHTLTITPVAGDGNENGLCRIRASWSAQVFISSLTGTQY